MDYPPGIAPDLSLEQALDLEMVRRFCLSHTPTETSEFAVKLRRDNQLLRAVVLELANELGRIAGERD